MTAKKTELRDQNQRSRELTAQELDRVSGGFRDNTADAFAIVAQAQAQAPVKSPGR
jgi:hypothetical protein